MREVLTMLTSQLSQMRLRKGTATWGNTKRQAYFALLLNMRELFDDGDGGGGGGGDDDGKQLVSVVAQQVTEAAAKPCGLSLIPR